MRLFEILIAPGASPLQPLSLQILFPYLAAALAALASVFHHRRLRARYGDTTGMRLYFGIFFGLLAAVPVGVVLAVEADPWRVLRELGLAPGNHRLGLPILGIALPITALMSYFASGTPEIKRQYPFSKAACSGDGRFARYELAYLLLYFPAWEFLYRGLLFFPLVEAFGFLAAASLTAALSTLHHIGHPPSEILGAFAGGYVFAAIALLTGSVLYPAVVHAMLGVSDDLFVYLRYYRGRR